MSNEALKSSNIQENDHAPKSSAAQENDNVQEGAAIRPRRHSYGDYFFKRMGMPQGKFESWVFKLVMVTGMMAVMVPWGHIVHGSAPLDAIAQAAPTYAGGWLTVVVVRLLIGDTIVGLLAPRLMARFHGEKGRTVAMAALNVLIMATVMSLFGAVMGGAQDILGFWAPALPAIWAFALLLNLFIVGPLAIWIATSLSNARAHARA